MKINIVSCYSNSFLEFVLAEVLGLVTSDDIDPPNSKRQRLLLRQPSRRALTRYGIRQERGCGTNFFILTSTMINSTHCSNS